MKAKMALVLIFLLQTANSTFLDENRSDVLNCHQKNQIIKSQEAENQLYKVSFERNEIGDENQEFLEFYLNGWVLRCSIQEQLLICKDNFEDYSLDIPFSDGFSLNIFINQDSQLIIYSQYQNQDSIEHSFTEKDDLVIKGCFLNIEKVIISQELVAQIDQERELASSKVKISSISMQYNPNYHNYFIYLTAKLSGPKSKLNGENLKFEWSFSQKLPEGSFISGMNSPQLTIKPGSLTWKKTYTATLRVYSKISGKRLSTKTKSFKTITESLGRDISFNRQYGIPLVTQMFGVLGKPINFDRYNFAYESEITGTWIPFRGFGTRRLIGVLPPSKKYRGIYFIKTGVTHLTEPVEVGIDYHLEDYPDMREGFRTLLANYNQELTSIEFHSASLSILAGSLLLAQKIFAEIPGGLRELEQLKDEMETNLIFLIKNQNLLAKQTEDPQNLRERVGGIQVALGFYQQFTHPILEFNPDKFIKALNLFEWQWKTDYQEIEYGFLNNFIFFFEELYIGLLQNFLLEIKRQRELAVDLFIINIKNDIFAHLGEKVREHIDMVIPVLIKKVPEGRDFKVRTEMIQIQIKTFSSYLTPKEEYALFEDEVTGSIVKFPLRDSIKPGERVSVAVVFFRDNPFFGSRYTNSQTIEFSIVGQQAFYVTYWKDQKTLLGDEYLLKWNEETQKNETLDIVYEMRQAGFSNRFFNKEIAFCHEFSTENLRFNDLPCVSELSASEEVSYCRCKSLSYMTVVEDANADSPQVGFGFKDFPFLIAAIYLTLFVLIAGKVFILNQEKQQKEKLLTDRARNFSNKNAVYTLAQIIQFRTSQTATWLDQGQKEIEFNKLFRLFFCLHHPLVQLYYTYDPCLPKTFYFLAFLGKMLVIFVLSFFMFKDEESTIYTKPENQYEMSWIMTFAFGVFLAPLPNRVMQGLRTRYFISRSDIDGYESEEEEEFQEEDEFEKVKIDSSGNKIPIKRQPTLSRKSSKSQYQYKKLQKVYVNLNLPLELLVRIKTKFTSYDLVQGNFKLPYASGDSREVVKQLIEGNEESAACQNSDSTKKIVSSSSASEIRNIIQASPAKSQKLKKVGFQEAIVDSPAVIKPFEVEVDMQEEEHQATVEEGPKKDIQMEGGQSESWSSSTSNPSFNEEFIKEMIQEEEIKVSLLRFLLAFIILIFLFFMLAGVVASELGQGLYKKSDWLWTNVFFGSQILGFVVIDTLVIFVLTLAVMKADKKDLKKQTYIARFAWQAFVWERDYRYVLDQKNNQ